MHRTLQYAILFIVMVILQIFLFSRIGISVYVHPLVCIAFIVLLPMEIAPLDYSSGMVSLSDDSHYIEVGSHHTSSFY